MCNNSKVHLKVVSPHHVCLLSTQKQYVGCDFIDFQFVVRLLCCSVGISRHVSIIRDVAGCGADFAIASAPIKNAVSCLFISDICLFLPGLLLECF